MRLLLRAAAVDASLAVVAAALASGVSENRRRAFWRVLVATTEATAIGIELSATRREPWRYAPSMPTIGRLGVVPLVQVPLLSAAATYLERSSRTYRGSGSRKRRSP